MKHIAARICTIALLSFIFLVGIVGPVRGEQSSGPFSVFLPLVNKYQQLPGWTGPGGGRILCLAIDPKNPANLFAGTVNAGVFKSTDGGVTWSESSQGLGGVFIQSLAIDPISPTTLYASVYKDRLYKSTNSGLTWLASSSGIQASPVIYSIAIDPKNSANIYISTRGASVEDPLSPDTVSGVNFRWNGELYKSSNFGATWTRVLYNVGGAHWQDWAYSLAVVPGRSSVIYAAFHGNGPYRSTDNGVTWSPINTGVTDLSGRSVAVDPLTHDPATVYFGVWHGGAVFKSTNGGDSWSTANSGILGEKNYPGALTVDPIQSSNVYFGSNSDGIYKSGNGGGSWSQMGLSADPIYSLLVHPASSQTLFAGTQTDGLYQSQNGGTTWAHSQAGLHANQATGLVINPANPLKLYASTNGSGVFVSNDHGNTWSDYNLNLPDRAINGLVASPSNPNLLFALTNANGLYWIDTSAGLGWIKTGASLPDAPASGPAFGANHPFTLPDPESELAPDAAQAEPKTASTALVNDALLVMQFAPSNPNIAYMGTQAHGLYKSSNGGASWSLMNSSGPAVTSLAVDPSNPSALYEVRNADSNVWAYNGSSWSSAALGSAVYALSFSPTDPTVIYAGTGGGVYRKVGSGAWTKIGLSGASITAVAGHPTRPGLIYAGTTSGAYFSADNGVTWSAGPGGLTGLTVESIAFDPGDSLWVYYATTTHDIYRALVK